MFVPEFRWSGWNRAAYRFSETSSEICWPTTRTRSGSLARPKASASFCSRRPAGRPPVSPQRHWFRPIVTTRRFSSRRRAANVRRNRLKLQPNWRFRASGRSAEGGSDGSWGFTKTAGTGARAAVRKGAVGQSGRAPDGVLQQDDRGRRSAARGRVGGLDSQGRRARTRRRSDRDAALH